MTFANTILTILTFLPLLGAAIILFIPKTRAPTRSSAGSPWSRR